jgi:hypothetical protein
MTYQHWWMMSMCMRKNTRLTGGGETPEPTDKMKDMPECLKKCREKNFRAPAIAMVPTLPLLFWKTCIGQSNKFAHQEMDQAKVKGDPENVLCGAKWRHNITLG